MKFFTHPRGCLHQLFVLYNGPGTRWNDRFDCFGLRIASHGGSLEESRGVGENKRRTTEEKGVT
jgi:hypothetical protein